VISLICSCSSELRVGALSQDVEEDTPEIEKTKKMEIEAIKLAENGKLDEALSTLTEALKITPNRASIYNNRAHVYQFQKKFSGDLKKSVKSRR
jgi:Tfp pilus assembly protein PilF